MAGRCFLKLLGIHVTAGPPSSPNCSVTRRISVGSVTETLIWMDNCPCSGNPCVDLFTHRGSWSCVIFHILPLSVFPPFSHAYLCSSPAWFFSSTPPPSSINALLPAHQLPPCSLVTSAPSPHLCLFPPAPHCFSLYLSPVISRVCCVCLIS